MCYIGQSGGFGSGPGSRLGDEIRSDALLSEGDVAASGIRSLGGSSALGENTGVSSTVAGALRSGSSSALLRPLSRANLCAACRLSSNAPSSSLLTRSSSCFKSIIDGASPSSVSGSPTSFLLDFDAFLVSFVFPVSFDDADFVDFREAEGLFPLFLRLLWSSLVVFVVLLSSTIANSSSNGTASSSSSLGNRSPLELKELVVLLLFIVSLLFLPCLPLPSPLSSPINGSASGPLLPTFSCKSATPGLYLVPLPPIFHGKLLRKPNIEDWGTTLGSSSLSFVAPLLPLPIPNPP